MNTGPDFYQILNVKPGASLREIKEAYKKLAFQYHPDRNLSGQSATKTMQAINEAYATLSNPVKRQQYDIPLGYGLLKPKYNEGCRVKISPHSNTPYRDHIGVIITAPIRETFRFWYIVKFENNGLDSVYRFAEDEISESSG